jgi:protein O-GlcNAc transferase
MLARLFGRSLERVGRFVRREKVNETQFLEAQKLALKGDSRGAAKMLREYLERDPLNVAALTDLGSCLADMGDFAAAREMFERAYTLDDTFLPTIANHAKVLHEDGKGAEALELAKRAKVIQPHFADVESVYASICMRQGRVSEACRYHLRAWLANFSQLRHVNSLMFTSCYDDIDEKQVAAEHRFWALTLSPPLPAAEPASLPVVEDVGVGKLAAPAGRIRIGYWSPDYRGHSVRYFFRPLLEGHDTDRFELFLFHDVPAKDEQTELIRKKSEHFYDVHSLTDGELTTFLLEQKLDVLVELSGHTSHNRLNLLQQRFATVQLTGIGYPPTTGLSAVDAKLLDVHLSTDQDAHYYSEAPLRLSQSFWCYDPIEEDPPVGAEPPMVRNGFVTFGCSGNAAKITDRILVAWARILQRVPRSRLVLRSLYFDDPMGLHAMEARLAAHGIAADRVSLHRSAGQNDFYSSYNDIDIILDTFPFNGGTTTCFATYMGVPVVSIAGHSVASRMGLSIMTNLGAPDLVVQDHEAYVRRAVELASDVEFLVRFKREARPRYKSTPLGNGKLFAQDYEAHLVDLLERRKAGYVDYRTQIAALPVDELMRRAYAVARRGQAEAVHRILDHALQTYPDHGPAHVLRAQLWAWDGKVDEARAYLRSRVDNAEVADRNAMALALARLSLLKNDAADVLSALDGLGAEDPSDFDSLQALLYRACATAGGALEELEPAGQARTVNVLIPCGGRAEFDRCVRQITAACKVPAGWNVTYTQCSERLRIGAYERAFSRGQDDILVILQKNLQVHNPWFFVELDRALDQADIVSFFGSERWDRLEWRDDEFDRKFGCQLGMAGEDSIMVDIFMMGTGRAKVRGGLQVLDGALLAIHRRAFDSAGLDEEMDGARTLLEEVWVHAAAQRGLRLAAHRNLGVFIDPSIRLEDGNWAEARLTWCAKHDFDPFAPVKEDFAALSGPVGTVSRAMAACEAFLI